jgi:uncharacterized membrane protein
MRKIGKIIIVVTGIILGGITWYTATIGKFITAIILFILTVDYSYIATNYLNNNERSINESEETNSMEKDERSNC